MEAMAHRNRWFSQLETSIYMGFSMAMLNNQRVYPIDTSPSYQASCSQITVLSILFSHSYPII